MSHPARVAITGYGSISALGAGVSTFEEGLRAGRCAIEKLSVLEDPGYRSACAAEVRTIPCPAGHETLFARVSRTTKLALVAAAEAVRMARLDERDCDARFAVVLGTTTGGMESGERCFRAERHGKAVHARLSDWAETPASMPADDLAHAFAHDGPRLTVSTACSSGANALGIAADWIRAERASAVLCGGADALCRMTFSGFNALQALDREPCRPFDRDRAGLSLGEGAALFVLESWAAAKSRGAAILGELVSYGMSADAHHLTQPRPDGAGAALAIRRALTAGGVGAHEIDYVNAHGTGTVHNDAAETRAIEAALGPHAHRIPVSSTKSMIGHTLGAAGALEALASLLAIRGGFVPPTATLRTPAPDCDLDYVPRAARSARLHTALSNSYGFGGNNTSLVLRGANAA